MIKGFKEIQALLPETGFAVGEWSLADAAIAPFIARLFVALENDLGLYAPGEGPKTLEIIKTSPELKRIQQYITDITTRKSFVDTFDAVCALLSCTLSYCYLPSLFCGTSECHHDVFDETLCWSYACDERVVSCNCIDS